MPCVDVLKCGERHAWSDVAVFSALSNMIYTPGIHSVGVSDPQSQAQLRNHVFWSATQLLGKSSVFAVPVKQQEQEVCHQGPCHWLLNIAGRASSTIRQTEPAASDGRC